ncbi:MAG: HD domain-containing protein [Candidatus Aminicenantes bacterium]|nr:HD domain-containing protein [Candidatus Aminicenantes bacterium]
MRNKLLSLIPEFQLIDDPELQEKTIKVWLEAMKKGQWQVEDLKEMPFTLLIRHTAVNIIEHTRAVTRCSLQIGDVLKQEYQGRIHINRDYLLAGALLHDVGKLFEYKRDGREFVKSEEGKLLRHPISGAIFAGTYAIPQEILHVIAAHSKEGDGARRTVEAIIVNHADFVNFEALQVE